MVLNFLSKPDLPGEHIREKDVIAFGRNYFGRKCKTGDRNGAPVCKRIRRRVVLIDEYFTSQKCHACGGQLEMNQATRMGDCAKCRKSWDRDMNAARNIRAVFNAQVAGLPRPAYLCRPAAEVIEGDDNQDGT